MATDFGTKVVKQFEETPKALANPSPGLSLRSNPGI